MESNLPNFDKLWNYSDPAGTERKFREILAETENSKDYEYKAQLLTQIARCEGLQGRFDEAHATLDKAYKLILENRLLLSHIRYFLERGRAFNSNGEPETAMPLFQKTYELAQEQNEMRYAIDAIHMIAIAERDTIAQIEWNLKGIALAEANLDQRRWLNALLNNIGESYLSAKDYGKAYDSFLRLSELQKKSRGECDIYTIKDMAKSLRLAGNPEEALSLIQPVFDKLLAENNDNGYIRQEIAEDLFALGKNDEAKPHFAKAYELLSKDGWIVKNEHTMLDRLSEFSR
jgi:tetratricopeptide (TPR) repeat protein